MYIELQEKIVHEVVGLVESPWEKIMVNMEIDNIDGERIISPEADFWMDGIANELRLDIDTRNCFKELREVMAKNDVERRAWKICDLEILSNGIFNFKFSYDEPPRL
jgi:hypothetical protein